MKFSLATFLAGLLTIASLSSPAFAAPPPAPPSTGDVTVESPPPGAVNLIKNGDFETPNAASDGPANWQQIDNLVYHWGRDADPARGRIMHIETDVGEGQAYAWWKKLILDKAPLGDAPIKIHDEGYGSIGGLDGGFYASDLIPIKAGAAYKVYVDAKGPGAKVFIHGYEKELPLSFADEQPAVQEMFATARGEPSLTKDGKARKHRLRYAYKTWFAVGGTDAWQTYTHNQPRNPTGREQTEDVRWIRIQLYPYWPTGTYEFDNVCVIEVPAPTRKGRPDASEADFEEGKVVK